MCTSKCQYKLVEYNIELLNIDQGLKISSIDFPNSIQKKIITTIQYNISIPSYLRTFWGKKEENTRKLEYKLYIRGFPFFIVFRCNAFLFTKDTSQLLHLAFNFTVRVSKFEKCSKENLMCKIIYRKFSYHHGIKFK